MPQPDRTPRRIEATLVDKLLLIPLLFRAIASVLSRLITSPLLPRTRKANAYLKDVLFAGVRTLICNMTTAQESYITSLSTTGSAYAAFAKKTGFQPVTTALKEDAKLHWFGQTTSRKAVLFFHGGGYALPATFGHIQWLYNLQQRLSVQHSVSVVLVEYGLSHQGPYPLQLRQAAESLQYLLKTQNMKPSDIFIGGDSAGGHMCLSLLSHILHPHPDAARINLSEPLASAILISPWVKFTTDDSSWERFATSDMLSAAAIRRWGQTFLGEQLEDSYNTPVSAKTEWFTGLDSVVGDVLIWAGGSECLIDSIQEIARTLKSAFPKTEIVVQEGAAHDDLIADAVMGYRRDVDGTKLIESWMSRRM